MNFDREYKCRIYIAKRSAVSWTFLICLAMKNIILIIFTRRHTALVLVLAVHLYLISVHDEWHYICDLRPVAIRRALFELFLFLRGNWPKSTSHRTYRGGYHHDEIRFLVILQVGKKHHISQCLFMWSDKWSLLENCLSHRWHLKGLEPVCFL